MNQNVTIQTLKPIRVWNYFTEICKIPRASKKEEKIRYYLIEFAKVHHLSYKVDKTGNVLISKPSTSKQNIPAVVLQSHMDMVCEKNSDSKHNFDTDPIIPIVEDGWVKATGTTLGADNGIGMAYQLAILSSNDIEHGPLECLFTVDEETGLTGAFALEENFFSAKILINLDSEDDGIFYIGCAGGIDTTARIPFEYQMLDSNNQTTYKISVLGLTGGHSGDDINKHRANAIKIIARIVYLLYKNFQINLIDIQGGNLPNAIPREAFMIFACSKNVQKEVLRTIEELTNDIKLEYAYTEKNLKITVENIENSHQCIEKENTERLIKCLQALPHGVISMSHVIQGLVETSTNLASIKKVDEKIFEITTSQRSSQASLKTDIAQRVASIFHLAKFEYSHSTGYPGWQPNPNSPILKKAVTCYEQLFGKKPLVTAIHAGLECGVFTNKYPYLDMISFGPTIKNAHSPDEMLNIESVEKNWKFLTFLLKNIGN